jgi:hypothetical protein
MLCATCYGMLRGHQGRQWRGTYDIHFTHHASAEDLAKSADVGCCICRVLLEQRTNAGLDIVSDLSN